MIRSQKLRDSAKGQACTFMIPGCCNYDRATTVLCHLPDESKGMGRKSDDFVAAFGCANCHARIDGAFPEPVMSDADMEFFLRRAMTRTWRYWIEKGLIKIAGAL